MDATPAPFCAEEMPDDGHPRRSGPNRPASTRQQLALC